MKGEDVRSSEGYITHSEHYVSQYLKIKNSLINNGNIEWVDIITRIEVRKGKVLRPYTITATKEQGKEILVPLED